ncbi:MAG: cell surface protein, partial [Bauldia sp.]|nr:cell surface protein [Bauldia sp.]
MADLTTDVTVKTPLQYLDKAMNRLRDLGLLKDVKSEDAPIVGLLEKITALEPDKVAVISRTLGQMSVFNEVVREQISEMSIGERYEKIAKAFNSIRDDAKGMVDQISDGKIDVFERATNAWMKISRGDIAARFDDVRDTYLDVARDTRTNIEREQTILEAYMDFRGALKQAEVAALEVLKIAEEQLDAAKADLDAAAGSS